MKSVLYMFAALLLCCIVSFGGCKKADSSNSGFEKKPATDAEMAPPDRDQKKVEAPPE
jgi:hypothetical protein